MVMASRRILFEDAVMIAAGVRDIPTFDNPLPHKRYTEGEVLGRACGERKIYKCMAWLQERAPMQTIDGKELKMVVTENHLSSMMCYNCKG